MPSIRHKQDAIRICQCQVLLQATFSQEKVQERRKNLKCVEYTLPI